MSCHRFVILLFLCCICITRVDATEVASITAKLGERLFNDERLSADRTVACATCHVRERAFANNERVGKGVNGLAGTRNVPTLLDVKDQRALFWDGRAPNLEAQASAPLMNPVEHGLADANAVLDVVRADSTYVQAFVDAYRLNSANQISLAHVATALAAFERTLSAAPTSFDRFFRDGNPTALSAAARRGFELFRGRGRCTTCHTIDGKRALFSDMQFHPSARGLPKTVNDRLSELTTEVIALKGKADNALLENAIATRADIAALGRFLVTLDPADIGRFKTPSLRHVATTAPYMHDGSVATLDEAIGLELYNRGAALNYPIVVTVEEKQDLVAFLHSLGGDTERTSARNATAD
jgi:cytochrome c peroxidase